MANVANRPGSDSEWWEPSVSPGVSHLQTCLGRTQTDGPLERQLPPDWLDDFATPGPLGPNPVSIDPGPSPPTLVAAAAAPVTATVAMAVLTAAVAVAVATAAAVAAAASGLTTVTIIVAAPVTAAMTIAAVAPVATAVAVVTVAPMTTALMTAVAVAIVMVAAGTGAVVAIGPSRQAPTWPGLGRLAFFPPEAGDKRRQAGDLGFVWHDPLLEWV